MFVCADVCVSKRQFVHVYGSVWVSALLRVWARFWTFRCFKSKSMRINIQYVAFTGIKPPPTNRISHPPTTILIICLASASAACGGKAAQSQWESSTNPYAKRQLMFALRNGIVRWMLRALQFRLGPPRSGSASASGSGSFMVWCFLFWLFVCEFSLPWQMNWRFRAFQLACGRSCATAGGGTAWRCTEPRGVARRGVASMFQHLHCTFSMGGFIQFIFDFN